MTAETERLLHAMRSGMNSELQKMADEMVTAALPEIERRMKKRLGEMAISLIEARWSVEYGQRDIRIVISGLESKP